MGGGIVSMLFMWLGTAVLWAVLLPFAGIVWLLQQAGIDPGQVGDFLGKIFDWFK